MDENEAEQRVQGALVFAAHLSPSPFLLSPTWSAGLPFAFIDRAWLLADPFIRRAGHQ